MAKQFPTTKNYLASNMCCAKIEPRWELMNLEGFAREKMPELIGGRKYGLPCHPNTILLPTRGKSNY